MITITPSDDDSRYRQAMFTDALSDNYLGSPTVVGGLVADYCLKVRNMLVQRTTGEIDAAVFVAQVNELGAAMSAIFSARDSAYKSVIGWNAISLGARLKVALGNYWAEHRDSHGDDPIKVLFAWLCWGVYDAMERSNGDPDLEGIILLEQSEAVIRLLLGTDRRA